MPEGGSPFGSWNGVEAFEFVDGVRLHAIGGDQVLLCRVRTSPASRSPATRTSTRSSSCASSRAP
jgi:hypothetical protein